MSAPLKSAPPTLIRVNGEEVTEGHVILLLKLQEDYRRAYLECIHRAAVRQYAATHDLAISDEELQRRADELRATLSLFSSDALQEYLRKRGVTLDQWADSVETDLLEQKVREQVITMEQVEKHFAGNPGQFTTVTLYRVVLEDREAAEETRLKLDADGEEFAAVARLFSTDRATAEAGGYMGLVKLGTLPAELERQVFASAPGSILGPVKDAGGYALYRAVAIQRPELTDAVREEIRATLYKDWRESLVRAARLEAAE